MTLFAPLPLRGVTARNRIWVSPMCQYSSVDGFPTDHHLVHLGQFALGGAGMVITEATAVTPEGRISPADAGIWSDAQADAYGPIARFLTAHGAVAGIQLGHAGRKASTQAPWDGRGSVPLDAGGWTSLAPSDVAYPGYADPDAMTEQQVRAVPGDFAAAAQRADAAGFDAVELHAAHGYLLHQFLSPLSNLRTDGWGGDFAGRTRLTLDVVDAVRAVWPDRKPLLLRLSATDWVDGGWSVEETVELSRLAAGRGVDLVDVSSGGLSADQQIVLGPGYQVPFAAAVTAGTKGTGLAVGAVGAITEPAQAEQVLVDGAADAVLLARAMLRDPHWALRAATELGEPGLWPVQYERAQLRQPSGR